MPSLLKPLLSSLPVFVNTSASLLLISAQLLPEPEETSVEDAGLCLFCFFNLGIAVTSVSVLGLEFRLRVEGVEVWEDN